MNDKSEHHWSFDYNYGAQNPQFTQELIGTLNECYTDIDARDTRSGAAITHIYNILPNYWRGYAGGGATESLSIGTVSIERSKQGGLWNYVVQYENTTSSENLRMRFRCCDEHHRPLTERWRVDVQNSGADRYSQLTYDGYLAVDSEARLHINGTEIAAGTGGASAKLTCNWALFDVIPALSQTLRTSSNGIELTLLEDLEHLRPKSRLGFLESVETPFPLEGYYVYGTGLLPSYWWLDVHGNIAIASTFFETLVLRERKNK